MAKVEISDEFVNDSDCMKVVIDAGINLKLIDYDMHRGVQIFDASGELIPEEYEECMFEITDKEDQEPYISNIIEVKSWGNR